MSARVLAPVAAFVVSVVALAGADRPGGAHVAPTLSRVPLHAEATPLYGIAGPRPVRLARVDPRTLKPVPGRQVPLAGHTFGWSFSPDRRRLAIGSDGSAEVRLVDLRRSRVVGDVKVTAARRGSVFATAWAGPARVLAVVVSPGCCGLGETTVAGIDGVRSRRLWQRRLHGSLQAGERFRRSLVLVLGPSGRSIGRSRLVLVNPAGRLRSVTLPEIRSGSELAGGGSSPTPFVVRQWNPGLAVDPSGARAFVVQAGAPVAEVDLRTLEVRSHTLSEPISLLDRLHDWLEPRADAKAQEGPTRHALWLGRGLLAVTGSDGHASVDGSRHAQWEKPAGLKLIDTGRWSVRTLDRGTSRIVLAGETLLAYGIVYDSRKQRLIGNGLTGYSLDGRRRFHLYENDPIAHVEVLDDRIIVGGALVDARTGRLLRPVRVKISLLVGDQAFWY